MALAGQKELCTAYTAQRTTHTTSSTSSTAHNTQHTANTAHRVGSFLPYLVGLGFVDAARAPQHRNQTYDTR